MKKFQISLLFISIISLFWLFLFLTNFEIVILNRILFFVILIFPLLGFIYSFPLIKEWGGLSSLMGKALFSLSLTYICNLIASISLYFITKSFFGYSLFASIFYYLTYICWILSSYYLLRGTGITKNVNVWKYLIYIVGTVSVIIMLVIYITHGSLIKNILDIVSLYTSFILWISTVILLIMSNRLKGGKLFIPFLLFFVGVFFQCLGDTTYSIRKLQGTLFMGDISFCIYAFSWFILSLVPARFPKEL